MTKESIAEAEAECRQIIGLEEKVLGPDHRLTLNSRANLAVAVLGQGRIEEAEAQIGDVMKSMEEKLGLGYPDTVSFTVKFATGLAHQNRREEAIKIAGASRGTGSHDPGPEPPGHAEVCQAFAVPEKPEVTTVCLRLQSRLPANHGPPFGVFSEAALPQDGSVEKSLGIILTALRRILIYKEREVLHEPPNVSWLHGALRSCSDLRP